MKRIQLALLALLFSPLLLATETYQQQKVIYHVNYDEPQRISDTFTNVSNHIEAVGEGRIDIKVMMHGKAIEYLMAAAEDEAKQIQLDALRLSGVQFMVCGNTLNGYNITIDDLYEVEPEDRVQAGLPAIVDLQQQGYIYVRP